MALLILPIGVLLGWLVRPPRRAAATTVVVGLVALIALAAMWASGVEVSPLETIVLVLATPIAAAVAFKVGQWRSSDTMGGRST